MLEDEMNCGDRIIMENEDFVTFLPFFSEYPYGMYIAAKASRTEFVTAYRQ